jgi:hypothetical protein
VLLPVGDPISTGALLFSISIHNVSFKRVVRNVTMWRIGPVPSDKLTVPAHERRRRQGVVGSPVTSK